MCAPCAWEYCWLMSFTVMLPGSAKGIETSIQPWPEGNVNPWNLSSRRLWEKMQTWIAIIPASCFKMNDLLISLHFICLFVGFFQLRFQYRYHRTNKIIWEWSVQRMVFTVYGNWWPKWIFELYMVIRYIRYLRCMAVCIFSLSWSSCHLSIY